MSLASFDDIFEICCHWDNVGKFEDFIFDGLNMLSSDSITYTTTSRRFAEKEHLNEKREEVLI